MSPGRKTDLENGLEIGKLVQEGVNMAKQRADCNLMRYTLANSGS